MKHREISKGVYALETGFVRVFLLEHEGVLTLIDTGIPGMGEKILSAIESLGYDRKALKHILITHFHMDHIGSLEEIKSRTGALVYVHKDEAATIGTVPATEAAPGIAKKLMFELLIKKSRQTPQPSVPVDVTLEGGEILDFAGGLQVIATPGHSPGHTSYFLSREGGILFVGDAASGGRLPGYPMLFNKKETAIRSLALIGNMNFEKAYFSHGKPIESGAPGKFRKAFGV
ncbi:MBL fold metallo-hydrolase [Spirochaeta isovalerica]|uniref:Glyoxylase-like metal-dependent hydrolase (Beta-lactamase superfamily II) n=1 Tax=Spirochaeta isovalerica TaxID=150 RepID=A0A841RC83_9SPIO|nr:MBL fold metallo-hydrolase [Spirochaeta isovalerica]MBB6481553.1 glyoxylase-like metal-dependent hydrolase (beta-lactamase superfamily II) [Spirochaeta isovalerica]